MVSVLFSCLIILTKINDKFCKFVCLNWVKVLDIKIFDQNDLLLLSFIKMNECHWNNTVKVPIFKGLKYYLCYIKHNTYINLIYLENMLDLPILSVNINICMFYHNIYSICNRCANKKKDWYPKSPLDEKDIYSNNNEDFF